MSKKDNFNEAVYSMFGVGKAPVEAERKKLLQKWKLPKSRKKQLTKTDRFPASEKQLQEICTLLFPKWLSLHITSPSMQRISLLGERR